MAKTNNRKKFNAGFLFFISEEYLLKIRLISQIRMANVFPCLRDFKSNLCKIFNFEILSLKTYNIRWRQLSKKITIVQNLGIYNFFFFIKNIRPKCKEYICNVFFQNCTNPEKHLPTGGNSNIKVDHVIPYWLWTNPLSLISKYSTELFLRTVSFCHPYFFQPSCASVYKMNCLVFKIVTLLSALFLTGLPINSDWSKWTIVIIYIYESCSISFANAWLP